MAKRLYRPRHNVELPKFPWTHSQPLHQAPKLQPPLNPNWSQLRMHPQAHPQEMVQLLVQSLVRSQVLCSSSSSFLLSAHAHVRAPRDQRAEDTQAQANDLWSTMPKLRKTMCLSISATSRREQSSQPTSTRLSLACLTLAQSSSPMSSTMSSTDMVALPSARREPLLLVHSLSSHLTSPFHPFTPPPFPFLSNIASRCLLCLVWDVTRGGRQPAGVQHRAGQVYV